MTVNKVAYTGFRNISSAEITFSDNVNLLVGNNAQGKTNALEGIYLCAAGRAFRTPHERDLVKFGDPFFEVKLNMTDSRRSQELSFKAFSGNSKKKRIITKNGVTLKKLSELVGVFRAVLFCPEHLSIVKEGPAERRSFIDIALCQIKPLYLASLQRYNAILLQRNCLLKLLCEKKGDAALLDVYSEQLALEAAKIFKAREAYIHSLDGKVKGFFTQMSGECEIPDLIYKNSLKCDCGELSESGAAEKYYKLLTSSKDREIAAGITLWGSHKDDMDIFLNGKEARKYASQGQQRSISLALKLGEGEISKDFSGEYPVFLFDDVLSELDSSRQSFLLSQIRDKQVIMTACTVPQNLFEANVISVYNGRNF